MKKGLYIISPGLMLFILVLLVVLYGTYNNTKLKHEKAEGILQNANPQNAIFKNELVNQIHPGDWKLIWADEFDDVSATLEKWGIEDLVAEQNNELQFYSTNNVKITNGLLTLISKKESAFGKNFTSGAVHTKNTFNFLYGKVEMRAKLPSGQGIFPAFWMMTNKENTWLPEIDILEMLGHKPNEIWMVLHTLDENNVKKTMSQSYVGENYSNTFHIFSLEWTPTRLTWLIDGEIRYEINEHIPHKEMYLYINTAIGGNWPGSPDHTTQFPTLFEIDYVRVYEKDEIN